MKTKVVQMSCNPHIVIKKYRGDVVNFRFHGAISREHAEKLVLNTEEGSYLTRESERQRGNYAVTLRYFHTSRCLLILYVLYAPIYFDITF